MILLWFQIIMYVYASKRKHDLYFVTDDLVDFKPAMSLQLAIILKLTSFIIDLNY